MAGLTLETLQRAVGGDGAAFRIVTKLQPAGGAGDKVFPPTYEGGRYVYEDRRLGDGVVRCVLLDSVQSQANRMEEALLRARERGLLAMPDVRVDFTSRADQARYGTISALQAPHRVADAILRDSALDGKPFRASAIGMKFTGSSPANATGLLEVCPAALVFGVWDSTNLGSGGRGAKFARTLVSEIVGIDVVEGQKAATRVDPLGIEVQAGPIYESAGSFGWTPDKDKARTNGKGEPIVLQRGSERGGRPSVINHGNVITAPSAGGVTMRYGLQTSVLSLAGLRKLRFPDSQGRPSREHDDAARTYLAALGLCALALHHEDGYDLRSRCVLVPEERRGELIPNRVAPAEEIGLSADDALTAYQEAAERLAAFDLPWNPVTVTLTPSGELVSLIQKNLEAIAAGKVDDG